MKRIIFITIFVTIFYSMIFPQTEEKIPEIIRHPLDTFGRLKHNDLVSRLDNLYINLQSEPNSEGAIIIKFEKNQKPNSKSQWLKLFLKCFECRKFDTTRFTFVISEGYQEQTDLWYVPSGAEIPNSKDSNIIIKGENLRQAMNKIFKK